jgi:hypothetical protein
VLPITADIDQINTDYVPENNLLAIEDLHTEDVVQDAQFSDIPPEIGNTIENTAPIDINSNMPSDKNG